MGLDDFFEDIFERKKHKYRGHDHDHHDRHDCEQGYRKYERPSNHGGRFCPNCGSSAPIDGRFCTQCGANLNTRRACTNCGKDLEPSAKFCGSCGNKVS